jgi:hypothetical protein
MNSEQKNKEQGISKEENDEQGTGNFELTSSFDIPCSSVRYSQDSLFIILYSFIISLITVSISSALGLLK